MACIYCKSVVKMSELKTHSPPDHSDVKIPDSVLCFIVSGQTVGSLLSIKGYDINSVFQTRVSILSVSLWCVTPFIC